VAGLELRQDLVEWAATTLDWRPLHVHDASWGHAESAVAQLVVDDGHRAYLKAHRQARKHRQERAALLQVREAAGAWLQRLHRLPPVDDDPLPLEEAVRARLEGWSRRAAGRLAPETLRWASARVGDADLAGVRRVPCHRDIVPRNWLWDDTTGLCVIDFEHAQPDVWWVDVHRLADEPWGAEHGDAPFEAQGRAVLCRLGAPGCGP